MLSWLFSVFSLNTSLLYSSLYIYTASPPYTLSQKFYNAGIIRISSIKETAAQHFFLSFFVLFSIGSLRDFGLEIKMVFILLAYFLIVEGKPESIVSEKRHIDFKFKLGYTFLRSIACSGSDCKKSLHCK
jgi:hypothetical protein